MTARVDVQVASAEESVPAAEQIASWVNRAIDAAGDSAGLEVSVRIVDLAEMQQLNKDFREQNKPTNVLSFPAGKFDGLPGDTETPLGDIVVCATVVADEARQQGKAEVDHWAHMIVHGTLHLLGFDHENDNDAVAMESLEIRIMTDHGIADPYAASVGESPKEN